ncbi:MAG: acetyltransferase [Bacteroidales bacterium]|nr:acetyltransferase [Bacteroidales bacterium]
MNKKPLLIYGAGGFGREIACLIHAINSLKLTWNLMGFIDDGVPAGETNPYGKVLGNQSYLERITEPTALVIAIASPAIIQNIVDLVKNPKIFYPNIIAPDVLFFDEKSLQMGQGNLLTFGCRMSCNVQLGNFNILNGQVSLGHDVNIGNYNVMMPETRISGETIVGSSNFFGVRSLVLQGIKIGNGIRIGAASVLMRNTKDNQLYIGNPARKTVI